MNDLWTDVAVMSVSPEDREKQGTVADREWKTNKVKDTNNPRCVSK